MATAASLLVLIDAAIEALLTGGASSYSIGARTVTKLDLGTLMEERRQLQIQVARETGSGGISLGKMTRHRR
jgi:cobalamin biosynthesis protein CobD/CbiB